MTTLRKKVELCIPLTFAFVWLLTLDHWLLWRVAVHGAVAWLQAIAIATGIVACLATFAFCLEEPWADFWLRRAQVRRRRCFAIKPIHHYSSKATYVGFQPTTPKGGAQ